MKSILTAVLLASCAWAGDVTNQGYFTSAEGITNIPAGKFAARFHDGHGNLITLTNMVRVTRTNYLPYSIGDMRDRGIVTNTVKTLAEAGEVCKVYGHMFRDGRPGESETVRYADILHGTGYRTCRICGKVETQRTGDWE